MSLWSFEGCVRERPQFTSQFPVVIAAGVPLFPFRTEQLSPPAPMVLGGQPPGRVGRRRIILQKGRRKRPFVVLGSKGGAPRRRLPAPAAGDRGRRCDRRRAQGRGDR